MPGDQIQDLDRRARRRPRLALIWLLGLMLWALACNPSPTEPASPTPTSPGRDSTSTSTTQAAAPAGRGAAVTAALPTSTAPPPPRPSAAPPALSAPSSPAASPIAAVTLTPRAPARVRAGALGALSDSGLAIGLERGFFAEQGLDVQSTRFSAAGALLTALAAGQIDAASVPISAELFTTLGQNGAIKMVAESAGAPPGHGAAGLVVRPDLAEGLRTPTDLRGLRLGLPSRGGWLEVELAALLKQGWLARTDVETIALSPADAGSALAVGTIDGAMLAEPWLSELEDLGIGVVWRRSDQIIPNHLTAVLLFAPRFARLQPDAARRFVTGYLKALRLYNDGIGRNRADDRENLISLLSRAGLPAAPGSADRAVLPGMNPNGMINIQTLRLDQRYFLASGQQQREVDLAAVIDTQYAAYAITQLGEYR